MNRTYTEFTKVLQNEEKIVIKNGGIPTRYRNLSFFVPIGEETEAFKIAYHLIDECDTHYDEDTDPYIVDICDNVVCAAEKLLLHVSMDREVDAKNRFEAGLFIYALWNSEDRLQDSPQRILEFGGERLAELLVCGYDIRYPDGVIEKRDLWELEFIPELVSYAMAILPTRHVDCSQNLPD